MEVSLKEDDILRVIKVILPALNLVISKTRELFSGEPSMTLKVIISTCGLFEELTFSVHYWEVI